MLPTWGGRARISRARAQAEAVSPRASLFPVCRLYVRRSWRRRRRRTRQPPSTTKYNCVFSLLRMFIVSTASVPAVRTGFVFCPGGNKLAFSVLPPAMQKAAFQLAKGRLSGCKRSPFTQQYAVFCKPCNLIRPCVARTAGSFALFFYLTITFVL